MNGELKVYKLKHPVIMGDVTCSEIKLSRPKTKDFIAVGHQSLDSAGAFAALISSISGVPMVIINQLDIDDLSILRIEAMRIFNSYFSTEPYELDPTEPLLKTEAKKETK